MAKIEINRVTNANIYADGNNLLGRAEEIAMPDIEAIMQDHVALGMIGELEFASGFKKLEGSIKWNSFYKDVSAMLANPYKAVQLQCRSNIETHGSQGLIRQASLVTFITLTFKKNPLGNFKPRTNVDLSSAFSATYIKQVIDGEEMLELDYMANIFRVRGEDILATYRKNIGG